MGDGRRARCKNCGRHRSETGEISWAGYCGPCGTLLTRQAIDELHYHRGPTFAKWRRGMAASVGATLDETRESA